MPQKTFRARVFEDFRRIFGNKFHAERAVCLKCLRAQSYRCNHNTDLLQQCGFETDAIEFIQQCPLNWGINVTAKPIFHPSVSRSDRKNIEFFLDRTFVHFYGGSRYYRGVANVDIDLFFKDKTEAFGNFLEGRINDVFVEEQAEKHS